jgi:hypothetical protein
VPQCLVTDDFDEPELCTHCGSIVTGDYLYVDVLKPGGHIDATFCGQDHAVAFFAGTWPEFEETAREPTASRLKRGALVVLGLCVAALAVIGGRTVFLSLLG